MVGRLDVGDEFLLSIVKLTLSESLLLLLLLKRQGVIDICGHAPVQEGDSCLKIQWRTKMGQKNYRKN